MPSFQCRRNIHFPFFRQSPRVSLSLGLGDLPGGSFQSYALAISGDGLVVVGQGYSANGNETFRCTEATGMAGLGDLPVGAFGRVYARIIWTKTGFVPAGWMTATDFVQWQVWSQ